MATQEALLVTAFGKPLTKSTTWPVPTPHAKEVRLRVTVAGLNPHDEKVREYGIWFKEDDLPVPLANDVVGVVDKVGPGVTTLQVGDRVFTYGNIFARDRSQAGLVQYALADEAYAVKIPPGFSDDDVATIPVNISAASIGLFDATSGLGLPAPWSPEAASFDYAGTTLLIIGGGSNCGRYAVQLAKLAGIGNIVVLGGKEDELKKYGATHVLDRHGGDAAVHARIKAAAGDDLIYVFDAVNPPQTIHVGINALSSTRRGKVARLLPTGDPDASKLTKKDGEYELIRVLGLPQGGVYGFAADPVAGKGLFENLYDYLRDGKIVPLKYEVANGVGLNADAVNEVLDRYRDGKPVIQTHIRVSE